MVRLPLGLVVSFSGLVAVGRLCGGAGWCRLWFGLDWFCVIWELVAGLAWGLGGDFGLVARVVCARCVVFLVGGFAVCDFA